jgi:glycerate 2-kinase
VKILIAPDKFKGSLSAREVCAAIESTLLKLYSSLQVQTLAMADGGEGTAHLLTEHTKGKWVPCTVRDPFSRKVEAGFGVSGDGETAFIEMAAASGLQWLTPWEPNPLKTSSVGTGDLVAHAVKQKVKKIVLAIGGSATNDAGMGMAHALGYKFYDQQNKELIPIGENLAHLQRIDTSNLHPRLFSTEFIVLCDVTNPLYGEHGAAYVFAPQKGASKSDVLQLDKGLQNFARVVETQLHIDTNFPGAGAAGGLGAGAKVFLHATMMRGIEYVMDALQLDAAIRNADLVITGEGKLDSQTLSGKVVAGITASAKRFNKPVVAIVGKNELTETQWKQAGIAQVISLVDDITPVDVAMRNPRELITKRIEAQVDLKII